MLNYSNSEIVALKAQIKKTIVMLENKYRSSGEYIVKDYIKDYQNAFDVIEAKETNEIIKKALIKLLNCARGYLETSSDYNQNFLNEMADTEKLIKTIL